MSGGTSQQFCKRICLGGLRRCRYCNRIENMEASTDMEIWKMTEWYCVSADKEWIIQ